MAEQLQDGRGFAWAVGVTSGNRLMTDIGSGVVINIGSVSAHVDSIYVQSGNIAIVDEAPNAINKNNYGTQINYISSGTSTGISSGSEIGTMVKFNTAGSVIRTLTYSNNNLTNIGSWV